ncbi:NUDIX domain-containing protein [Ornithinicoccus halotolerans]|uniref:NUDIX domain-containing protein n=1 Tax=Ornithinicoccus halotolerans TaxID=1748220 RepID=UPI00129657CD|nr:NUDIX domain-containing protein [Ornithinicoccus halotolerans]
MPVSPHIARLRESVGHDLLLLPSVAVLPRDEQGRVLLVLQTDRGQWGTIGGAVEPDESPGQAAVREAREEAGVEVELAGILAVVGGPRYRITYPNGDRAAYVSTVYAARVIAGEPAPDHDETSAVAWVAPEQLADLDLGDFARAMFEELDWLRSGRA